MLMLWLTLDDPRLADQVVQAWTDLGLRGIHVLESTACAELEPAPARGPAGFLSFASLFAGGRYCYVLLLAPVESAELAERAADAVTAVAGPWSERPRMIMLALPVQKGWGAVVSAGAQVEAGGDG